MNIWKMRLVASVVALCLSPMVFAQNHEHGSERPATIEKAHKMRHDMKARYQARLHDALKLNAEQELAWKQWVETHPTPAARMSAEERSAMAALNTPARMEKMLEKRQQALLQMQKHVDHLKRFYATLSAEQQKTFDEQHRKMAQRMHGRMRAGIEEIKVKRVRKQLN